ncbi:MAG TPA: hypothetical protein VLI89_04695 [Burkholderiales bacterium]|nr:hypothetical protein [Burkholderiales bacterium]
MAPKEPIQLPLRWEFTPQQHPRTGIVSWKWTAYSHSGKVEMRSKDAFDTLTECMNDAKQHGYQTK